MYIKQTKNSLKVRESSNSPDNRVSQINATQSTENPRHSTIKPFVINKIIINIRLNLSQIHKN